MAEFLCFDPLNDVHPRVDPVIDLPIPDLAPNGLTSLRLLAGGRAYEDHSLGIVAVVFLPRGVRDAQRLVSLSRNWRPPAPIGCLTRSSFLSRRVYVIFFCCMQRVRELGETLYSLSLPLASASKVIRRLDFQQATFGRY